MPLQHTEWTVEMVNELPDDGNRYEVIDGELFVTPAPSDIHQRAVLELVLRLAPFTKAVRLDLLFAPVAITFSNRREVQPDVVVKPTRPDGKLASSFREVGRLILAVEVLSPSSVRTDRHRKRVLYQEEVVPEYWIVDPDSRTIERWRPDSVQPEILASELSWQPDLSRAPLTINLPEYFREVFWE